MPAPMKFEKHLFICTNQKEPGKECCGAKGSETLVAKLKELVTQKGLQTKVRVNKSGCLGQCSKGITVVVYPEGTWCERVTVDDAPAIFEKHLAEK